MNVKLFSALEHFGVWNTVFHYYEKKVALLERAYKTKDHKYIHFVYFECIDISSVNFESI